MRVAPSVVVDPEQHKTLKRWARSRSLPSRQVERARIVLLAAEGRQDLEIAAVLASQMSAAAAPALGLTVAILGAWILFKTQLDSVEGMVRSVTDILWTGSARVRAWRGGDIRAVYYAVFAVVVVWGLIAMKLQRPMVLLLLGANIAGAIFVFASLHLLYLNTRILPEALRPPLWRRVALVGMSLFYGFFVALVIRSFI